MKGLISNITKNLMPVGKGIVGGAGGRVLNSKLAPMIPGLKDHPKLHPLVSVLVGLGVMGTKQGHDFGYGMAVVSGTDMLGNFVPMIKGENIGDAIDSLADDLADILEDRLSDDVSNAHTALNDDLSDDLNDDLSDDVSNAHTALNDDLNGPDDDY